MGSPESEEGRDNNDEDPRHRVRITRPFYLGVYEVTQAEFERVAGRNPSSCSKDNQLSDLMTRLALGELEAFGSGRDYSEERRLWLEKVKSRIALSLPRSDAKRPVETVSWEDAMEFCKKLSSLPAEAGANRRYRLPTEAEWEYACRAGTTTPYYHGDDPEGLARVANVADATAKETLSFSDWTTIQSRDGFVLTAPVGSFRPNAFGLYDMHGNVWEWGADRYECRAYSAPTADDPIGTATGQRRVERGGGWDADPGGCRSAVRDRDFPEWRDYVLGFRVAFTVELPNKPD